MDNINKKHIACSRMNLNSNLYIDDEFNKEIVFVAEEYIGDDVPVWHEYGNLKDMLIKAYSLKIDNKLNAVTILDGNRNGMSTDALNCFDDMENVEQIKKLNKMQDELNQEINLYREFIKEYKATETFNKFKESRK